MHHCFNAHPWWSAASDKYMSWKEKKQLTKAIVVKVKKKKSEKINSLTHQINDACLEWSTGKNKLYVFSVVVTVWMYCIGFYTIEFELILTECIDLNYRGKCFSKGNKLKWGFAMSGASKERLLGSNSLISKHIFSFTVESVCITSRWLYFCNEL